MNLRTARRCRNGGGVLVALLLVSVLAGCVSSDPPVKQPPYQPSNEPSPMRFFSKPIIFNETEKPGHIDLTIEWWKLCPGGRERAEDSQISWKLFDRYGLADSGYVNLGNAFDTVNVTIPISGSPPYVIAGDRASCVGSAFLHGIVDGERLDHDVIDYDRLLTMSRTVQVAVPAGQMTATTEWNPSEFMYAIAHVWIKNWTGSRIGTLHFQNPNGDTIIRESHVSPTTESSSRGAAFLVDGVNTLTLDLAGPHSAESKGSVGFDHMSLLPEMCRFGPFEWSICGSTDE